MATNAFFNNQTYIPEQTLLDDLCREMIQIYGMDVWYIIRNTQQGQEIDPLFEEAPNSTFTNAIPIEMYLNSYQGFGGPGDLVSKFGLDVPDELTLSVHRRRFAEDIGMPFNLIRPQEGDLVYFPLTNGVFEIRFVEHEATFYQTGALQTFELNLEKFEYNSEVFATGVQFIDILQQNYSMDTANFFVFTENGFNIDTENGYDLELEDFVPDEIDPLAQNDFFENNANTFVDNTETSPFSGWDQSDPFGDLN
jgi:hypothetical protein